MDERSRAEPLETPEGVFFDLPELEIIQALSLPGLRVEILATSPLYEEAAVFRGSGSPCPVLGTLHKTQDGFFVLTRPDDVGSPALRKTYLCLGDVLPQLGAFLSRGRARSS